MKILITGACGLVARSLIAELESNHQLTLVDRTDPREATVFSPGSAERKKVPLETRWPFIKAEITDHAAMREAVRGHDAVIHLAAAVTGLPEHGVETMHANVCGTFAVLDACRLEGVKRFLCASSINAFGTIYWRVSGKAPVYTSMPLTEDFAVQVEDPYSLSKYVNELTCAAFTRGYGMTTAAFRFAGIITDQQYREALAWDGTITSWSDDLFQWVHLEDVAHGIRQAVEHPNLPAHGVYTLGAADTRANETTMQLLERFRPDLAANLTKPLPGRTALMSIDAARQAFGYEPRFRMERKIQRAAAR